MNNELKERINLNMKDNKNSKQEKFKQLILEYLIEQIIKNNC